MAGLCTANHQHPLMWESGNNWQGGFLWDLWPQHSRLCWSLCLHYAYIKLILPVFHIRYFWHIISILQQICKVCCVLCDFPCCHFFTFVRHALRSCFQSLSAIYFWNSFIAPIKQGLAKGVSTAHLMVQHPYPSLLLISPFWSNNGNFYKFLAMYINSETPRIPLQIVL